MKTIVFAEVEGACFFWELNGCDMIQYLQSIARVVNSVLPIHQKSMIMKLIVYEHTLLTVIHKGGFCTYLELGILQVWE